MSQMRMRNQEKSSAIHELLPKSQQRLHTGEGCIQLDYYLFHKGDFRDALALRYGWYLNNLPANFSCGEFISVDHALMCHKGGYTIFRHNALRDLTETLLREVCPNTSTEPALQPLKPLSGDFCERLTANWDQEARLDSKASGFWCVGQEAFFDVQVFHPNIPSYRSKTVKSIYRLHEQGKGAMVRGYMTSREQPSPL